MHSALLAVVPSVSKQIGMVEHLLRDEVQNEPVVGVQCASPHTHPALLATLPSYLVQKGAVTQRLLTLLYWYALILESVLVLKRREEPSLKHPGGMSPHERTYMSRTVEALFPKLTAAAPHTAWVLSPCLPVTELHSWLLT